MKENGNDPLTSPACFFSPSPNRFPPRPPHALQQTDGRPRALAPPDPGPSAGGRRPRGRGPRGRDDGRDEIVLGEETVDVRRERKQDVVEMEMEMVFRGRFPFHLVSFRFFFLFFFWHWTGWDGRMGNLSAAFNERISLPLSLSQRRRHHK
jgi:hypothetical protein